MNIGTDRVRGAGQIHHHFTLSPGRRAPDVVENNVRDVHCRGVRGTLGRIHIKVALVQYHRFIRVLDLHVAIRDIADATVPYVGTGPCLQASSVLSASGPFFKRR